MQVNNDKWITIHPNGEENKGRALLLKDGESPQEAIERTYKEPSLFGKDADLGKGKKTAEQEKEKLVQKLQKEWEKAEEDDSSWVKAGDIEEEFEKAYGAEELNRLVDSWYNEEAEEKGAKERAAKYEEWKKEQKKKKTQNVCPMFYQVSNALSMRHKDDNGFMMVDESPILRTGILEYYGSELLPEGETEVDGVKIDKNKIYKVFISPEELEKAKDSFKLLPITNDHTWMGTEGEDPKKYQEGSTGENITIKNGMLYAPLKFTGKKIIKSIENGKEELSSSYYNRFVKSDAADHDFDARDIKGNHLALVDKGRCGSKVRVLNENTIGVNNMDWNEADHPRDDAGRFTDKSGESGGLSYKFEKAKRPDGKDYDYEKASFKYNDAEIDAIKRGDGWISGKIYAPEGKKIKGTGDTWMDFETKEADFDNYIKSVVKDSTFYGESKKGFWVFDRTGSAEYFADSKEDAESYIEKMLEPIYGERSKNKELQEQEYKIEEHDENNHKHQVLAQHHVNNEIPHESGNPNESGGKRSYNQKGTETMADKEEEKKAEEKDEVSAVENEDKRKLIDEIGGILKGKVDEEVWRTVIGKIEKAAYNPSETSKSDDKCKSKNSDEPKEDEEKEDEKEDAKEAKSQNYDAIVAKVSNAMKAEAEKKQAALVKAYNACAKVLGDFNPFGLSDKDMYVKALNHMSVELDGEESVEELSAMLKACNSIQSKVDNSFNYGVIAKEEIETNW